MNTNATTTETTTKAKAARKPRAKKTEATAATAEPAKAQPEAAAPNAGTSNTAAMTAAALGLAVIFTAPPAWKLALPDKVPYWSVQIKDTQGNRYSDVYRIKDQARAEELARRIAADRKLPLKIIPTAQTAPQSAAPQEEDTADLLDEGEPAPF